MLILCLSTSSSLPLGGIACCLLVLFMPTHRRSAPRRSRQQRLVEVTSGLMLLASVGAVLWALSEGGIEYPWSQPQMWLPLLLGIIGLCCCVALRIMDKPSDCRGANDPIEAFFSQSSMRNCVLQVISAVQGGLLWGSIAILPIYFQAVKGSSAIEAAYRLLPMTALIAPFTVIAGGMLALFSSRWRMQTLFWWSLAVVGFTLLYLMAVINTAASEMAVYLCLCGCSMGAVLTATAQHATTSSFVFSSAFGSIWGIALPITTFTTTVHHALASIPGISDELRGETALALAVELQGLLPDGSAQLELVRLAYASALRTGLLWFVPTAVAGLIATLLLRDDVRTNPDHAVEASEAGGSQNDVAWPPEANTVMLRMDGSRSLAHVDI